MKAALRRILILAAAYLAGAIPFSNLFAGRLSGVDLRRVGSGTVSGTGLYRVAGFRALAVSGVLDITKGASVTAAARLVAAGPDGAAPGAADADRAPAGTIRPHWRPPTWLESAAAGLVVAGHNWSPYLDGAGGRGIAPSLGAYLVIAPEGAGLLIGGLTAGRLLHQSGLGTLAGQLALVPVLTFTRGRRGALAGVAVLAPMLAKRILGNGRPAPGQRQVYLARLLFDRDDMNSTS